MSKKTRFGWAIAAIALITIFLIASNLLANSRLQSATAAACDRSYPTVCIPSPPPDLNCPGIPYKRFKVLKPDPHRFDRDGNGIGCERD